MTVHARAALDGVTVLDFATVGPAARASRLLSDYGAAVVKIGAVPRAGVQIEPPFYAYSAGRDTSRIQLDLKAPEPVATPSWPWPRTADVVLESFRPGVVDRLGIGYDDVARGQPGHRLLLDQRVRPDRSLRRAGPATTSTTSAWAATSTAASGRPATSRRCPAPPWPTPPAVACRRSWPSWPRWCAGPRTGEGAYLDVSIADGVLSLMALVDRRVPGHRGRSRDPVTTSSPGATPATTPTECADDRWVAVGAIEPASTANLCRRRSTASAGSTTSSTTRSRTTSGPTSGPPSSASPATSGSPSWARPTPASGPVYSVPELVDDPHVARPGPDRRGHRRPCTAPSASSAPLLAGAPTRAAAPVAAPPTGRTDTDEVLAAAGLERRRDRRAAPRRSRGMTDHRRDPSDGVPPDDPRPTSPPDREGPVPRGRRVRRRARLHLDQLRLGRERQPAVLGRRGGRRELTDGPIAPPSMLSVWFRPHHWSPGRTEPAVPLQVHFDLKERFGLPEAVMTDNTIVFHEPVRPGDRAAHPPDPALGERSQDHQAGHRTLLGDRRRVLQPARRAGRRRELHRVRLPAPTGGDRDHGRPAPTASRRSTRCTWATPCRRCATT